MFTLEGKRRRQIANAMSATFVMKWKPMSLHPIKLLQYKVHHRETFYKINYQLKIFNILDIIIIFKMFDVLNFFLFNVGSSVQHSFQLLFMPYSSQYICYLEELWGFSVKLHMFFFYFLLIRIFALQIGYRAVDGIRCDVEIFNNHNHGVICEE